MIVIDGPAELSGELKVQGAKNSTLPLLAATVLCRGQTVLHNCPRLSDVDTAVRILEHLGSRCQWQGDSLVVENSMTCCQIPPDLMREMRSSIVFLGAIVSRCGARIYGAGEGCLIIDGVKELYGCEHTVMPDRIATVTYMAAAAVTGGNVTLRDVDNTHILPMLAPFEQAGCSVRQLGRALNIMAPPRLDAVRHIRTMPYPGFPTDAQPLVMSMAAVGRGTSIFVETIFENRYKHAEGLQRLGANIKVEGKVAIVEGVEQLRGAPVMSHDLRGGAALVVAGLCAKGRTEVGGVEYIRRGYENLAGNLASLGARIREVGEPTP